MTRKDIVSVIGEKAMKKLIAWRPGGRFRVSKYPNPVISVIGPRATKALCRSFPQSVVYIPLTYDEIDRSEINKLMARGMRVRVIARKVACSVRTVYRVSDVSRRKRNVDRDRLKKLLAQGKAPSEIAQILSCSRQTVYRFRKEAPP